MSELKSGALAIVINSHAKENIGKVVLLMEFYGKGVGHYRGRNDMWFVNSHSSELFTQIGKLNAGEKCSCPGAYLMPINGDDFSHEDERQKELIHG